MDHDVTLIATVAMGILAALVCGFLARQLRLPVIVGYMVGGILVGPSTPGFVADNAASQQFGELGVIFMMFAVGLHFSLRDLSSVKAVAVPGALFQMAGSTALGWAVAHFWWGWSHSASLVVGLAISIASTVVLLRGLTDRGQLGSRGGRTAVGWLILEDLATIAILVLLPAFFADRGDDGFDVLGVLWSLGKAVVFVALVLLVGDRVLPWLLQVIARTRSRELFLLAVLSLAAGTAYGAYELFGVGFALGAFLAGVVMGGRGVRHQVEAEVVPFRDIFAVLFFVAVGMQVDLGVVVDDLPKVLVLVSLVVVGKTLLTLSLAFAMPRAARDLAVVAAGLSQIGEFSFIVGQAGLKLDLIDNEQYALILAAAVVSIMVNPLMFHLVPSFEAMLLRMPFVGPRMQVADPGIDVDEHDLQGHVVLVGYGRVGRQTVEVLRRLEVEILVVDVDAANVEAAESDGLLALFGDASNSDILDHAGLSRARALVVTVPNQISAELIVGAATDTAPELPVIVRAGTMSGVARLHGLGATRVINPELEGGLEIVSQTLEELRYPASHVQPFIDAVRREVARDVNAVKGVVLPQALQQLVASVGTVDIVWHSIAATSAVVGQTLADSSLRQTTGASVVAVLRAGKLVPNPSPDTVLEAGDLLGLLGTSAEVAAAEEVLAGVSPAG